MSMKLLDEFSSPARKLLPFFKKSRDRWKDKYKELKKTCKLLRNQTRAVENSREGWRQRAETSEARVAELERELEQLKFEQ